MSGWVTRVPGAIRRSIPARTTMLMGSALLVIAAAQSQQHDTDIQFAYLGSGLVVVPVLTACLPFGRPSAKGPLPSIAWLAALLAAALGALILVVGVVQIANWKEQLWAVPGLIWAVSSGLALFAGGVVRSAQLFSREWPKGDRGVLVLPSSWGRRKQLAVVATVAAFTVIPSAVAAGTGLGQTDTSTATGVKAQPIPGRLNSVAWRTTLAARPKAVYAGSTGPIVAVDGGVRGYDGGTGKEIWHYVRREARSAVNSAITPDHRLVVVASYTKHGWSTEWHTTRYTVLDSGSGAVRNSFDVTYNYIDLSLLEVIEPDLLVGDQVIVTRINDTIAGFSLTTGKRLWERPLSAPDCYATNRVIAQDVMLQADHCFTGEYSIPDTEGYTLQGISLQSGRPAWKQSISATKTAGAAVTPQLKVSPDGRTLAFDATVRSMDSRKDVASAHWLLDPSTGAGLVKGGTTWNPATEPIPTDGTTWMRPVAKPSPDDPDGDYIQLQAPRKKEVYRPSSIETPDYLTSEMLLPGDRGWTKLSDQLAMVGTFRNPDSRSDELEAHPELPTVRSVWLRAILGDLPTQILPGAHVPGGGVSDHAIELSNDTHWQIIGTEQPSRGDDQFLIPAPGAVVAMMARSDTPHSTPTGWQLVGLH